MNRSLALLPAVFLAGCFSQSPAPTVDRTPTAQAKSPSPVPAVGGPGFYTVKRGDTLYRIALEHGQDYRDIAGWNNVTNPGSIKEGQVLRVAPPGAADSGTAVAKPIANGGAVEARPLDKAPPPAVSSDGVRHEPRVNKEPYSDEAYARLSPGTAPVPKAPEPKAEPKPDVVPAPPAAPAPGADDVGWMWPSAGRVVSSYSDGNNKGLDIAGKAGDAVLAAADGKVLYAGTAIKGYGNMVIIGHKGGFNSVYAHNRKILVEEKQQVTKGQKIAEMGNSDSDSVKLHFEIRRQGRPVDPGNYLPKR